MKVELFHAPGCQKCAAARNVLRQAAERAVPGVVWREVNVVDEIDYAAELGVFTTPAIAIDRELVFAALPSAAELVTALLSRRARGIPGGC
ncbi:MAG: glutaredoxin family protein [Gammaproteobacteria bacterium]